MEEAVKGMRKSRALLFLGFFCFSLFAAAMLRCVLIPRFMPSRQDGNGLLLLTDSTNYHLAAITMSEKMRLEGWSAWQLRPDPLGGIPVSFSAVLYYFFGSGPWAVLIFNALIHAFTGMVLFWIFGMLDFGSSISLGLAWAFIVCPSTYGWVSQILRDGYVSLGFYLILGGWIQLFLEKFEYKARVRSALLALFAGVTLTWLARDLFLPIYLGLGILAALPPLFYAWTRVAQRSGFFREALTLSATFLIFITLHVYFISIKIEGRSTDSSSFTQGSALAERSFEKWQMTPGLPSNLERIFFRISEKRDSIRRGYEENPGASYLDQEISFQSAGEVLVYLPRALQIGLLAPFPSDWFSPSTESKWRRLLVIPEMIMVYLALFGLVFLRRKFTNWSHLILVIFCSPVLVMIALTVNNLGALYRYRFPYWFLIAALGVGAFANYWREEFSGKIRGNVQT